MGTDPRALLRGLDAVLVGQDTAKSALVLALLARQHALLEGPPGCGKSALAQGFTHLCGGGVQILAGDRGLALGELRLRREPARGGGERIALERTAGALARARLGVIDDLDRADPGGLALLLRWLVERRVLGQPAALECAVATLASPDPASTAAPIAAADLDRFAVQVRMRGLCTSDRLQARALLDAAPPTALEPVLGAPERHELQARAAALPIAPAARAALLRAVERLRAAAGEEPVLLSDRSFGPVALAILRAHALLRGAERTEPEDVRALRFLLARRIPRSLEPHVDAILEQAIADAQGPTPAVALAPTRPAEPGEGFAIAAAASQPAAAPRTRREPLPARRAQRRAQGEQETDSVERIVAVLAGELERGLAAHGDHPAGSPRGWRPLRRLDELEDADPLDALLLARAEAPGGVRVLRRRRRRSGGALAVLRDVSASMEGPLARWSGRVVRGLLRASARLGIRVGYVEFNHEARRFERDGAFFHRSHGRLLELATRESASGRTSYEAPLRAALGAFRGAAGRERHIVLISDGVPVVGDPEVRRERRLCRALGVRVHTVFLGRGEHPAVLETLAAETAGLCFEARPRATGRMLVRERPVRGTARGARP